MKSYSERTLLSSAEYFFSVKCALEVTVFVYNKLPRHEPEGLDIFKTAITDAKMTCTDCSFCSLPRRKA